MIQIAMLVAALAFQSAAAQERTGAITGTIRSVNGDLAPGVRVMAVMADGSFSAASEPAFSVITETGADGRYRFIDLPPGAYYVVAGRLETPTTYFPGVRGPSAARVMLAPAGRTLADVDFALTPPPLVSGRVIGLPLSLPSNQVRVVMTNLERPLASVEETVIGADGSFEFTDVTPGAYHLFVQAPVLESKRIAIRVRETDVRGLELISPTLVSGHVIVEEGTPLPMQVETPPGAPDPLTWFRLDIRPTENIERDGPQPRSAVVHADGAFLVDVTPGSYTVGVDRLLLGYYVKSITVGGADLLREPLTLNTNVAPPELSVTLTRTPPPNAPKEMKVTGRVVVKAGDALPQWVRLEVSSLRVSPTEPLRFGEAPVRADGTFEFSHVPAGHVNIHVLQSSLPPRYAHISDTDAHVELKAGEDPLTGLPMEGMDPRTLITALREYRANPMGHEYNLCEAYHISGLVTGQMPLPAKIQLTLTGPAGPLGGLKVQAEAAIDSTGRFRIPDVPPGLYGLRIPSPSLVPLPLPELRVDNNPSCYNDDVEIRLPAIASIPGRIVVEGGRPVPDAVRVNIQGGIAVATEPDGRFTLPLAAGGHYALFITGLPRGYEVRSILQAGRDLQREALKVEEGRAPAEIVVTLTPVNGVQ